MDYLKRQGKWLAAILGVSLAVHILIETISRGSLWEVLAYMGRSPLVFLLNTLIVALPFVLLFFTRRRYFVMTAAASLWILAGAVNGFLLTFRTTPFTAADFRLVKYAVSLLTDYMTWPQIIGAGAGIVLLLALWAWCFQKAPAEPEPVRLPVSAALAAACALLVVGGTTAAMGQGILAVRFGNIGQAFLDYGFPYCFSNSLLNTGISRPEGYDSETVAAIEEELKSSERYEVGSERMPNVIMVQLESFFDPLQYRNYQFEKDPIPFFRYLKDRYPSGYLSVPSVGAGTANTEFECITGMNLDFFGPGEYPYKTVLQKTACESTAFDLKKLGYSAHAIHNNEGTFYDRHKVFAQLGFDTFTPIEYMYGEERNPTGWCRDEILVGEIEKALDSTKEPDFVYTISVQGHGAYPSFEYYCEQISEMDRFIQDLVYALNRREEPTVLVLYGDHLPGFEWEAADMKNYSLFQTQYVVWNNLNLEQTHRTVEAYQLAAWVLDMAEIHEGTMIRYHQSYLDGEIESKQQYLDGMKVLEYDILYGDHEIYQGESPFAATQLQMGIDPIVPEDAVYKDSHLLIFGEGFNRYSKVFLGDEMQETTYVWPELILVKDVDPDVYARYRDQISVKQVGKDKQALGTYPL